MATPSAGTVVLVRFPFSDLSGAKLRPAVVLASVGRGDFILCQVTSNPYSDAHAIEIADESFESGSLQRISYARPGKTFTANEILIASNVGVLKTEVHRSLVEGVATLLRSGISED